MNTINADNFKSLDYWFAGAAGSYADIPFIEKTSVFFYTYINIFIVIFVTGLILNLLSVVISSHMPIVKKLSLWGTNLSWIGFLAMLWFSLRETKVAFFGARFWILVGLIWVSVIIINILKYFIFNFEIERKHYINKTKLIVRH